MSYFIDPYKKYYELLSQSKNMTNKAGTILTKINEIEKIITNVNSSISNSGWQELGISELSDNVLPTMKSNINVVSTNVTNVLSEIVSKALEELLPTTQELKEADEQYEEVLREMNQLVVVPRYRTDGSINPGFESYINRKNELESKRLELKNKCESCIRKCNSLFNSMKSLDSKVEEFKVVVSSSGNLPSGATILESVENGKMLRINYNGKEYYVVNTKINCLDYEKYVQKNGLNQNGGILGGECMLLSQYYAVDMLRGTWTDRETMANKGGGPATRINDYVKSESQEPVLKYIYEEALAGRPTVLQVSQVNSYKGERHLVTVVGFDSSVQSYKDLTPDKIFVLDCVDGKLQTLGKARAEGGHQRTLFAQGGTYFARGATKEFLAREVTTVNNSATA